MESVVTVVGLAMASVLLWAGLEKARGPAAVASAMTQLGVPLNFGRAAATLLVAGELAVALGLVFHPGAAATLAGVTALATAFAAAGLVALARGERIQCSCFGPGGGAYLGQRQVMALPLWLAGGALLWLEAPPRVPVPDGVCALALVGLTLAALRSLPAARATKAARDDRRSAEEMLVWLRH